MMMKVLFFRWVSFARKHSSNEMDKGFSYHSLHRFPRRQGLQWHWPCVSTLIWTTRRVTVVEFEVMSKLMCNLHWLLTRKKKILDDVSPIEIDLSLKYEIENKRINLSLSNNLPNRTIVTCLFPMFVFHGYYVIFN